MIVITKNEYYRHDFYELYENSWSGARDTMEKIIEHEKEEEFMDLLNDVYFVDYEEIEDVELNDFIWHDRETIYNDLGLDENGDIIDN